MKLVRAIILFMLFFSFGYCSFGQNNKPRIAPEPKWITKNLIDYKNSALDKDAEDGYIDVDYEKQVSLSDESVFVRRCVRILSNAGVQNASQVSISFDPSYQQLIFHTIEIIRNGKIINQLNLSKIKTIQEEKDLDNFIYNGTLNAVMFLEDVRQGDVIEYSYTRKGFNSIFNKKYADIYGTRFSAPFCFIYYKLMVPAGRRMNIKNSNEDITPAIIISANNTIYEWKKTNVMALHVEDNIPTWYDPFPEIMISEYNSWKEVNDWALKLFDNNCTLSSSLKNKIGEIEKENITPEQRILATLHFVQDEIRYMGIEMGQYSHKPQNPDKVFIQRFGDCKEKSYLFCCMMKAMGVEAAPVLINTDYKKALFNWLPSLTDFDHATVRIKLNNKFYWFDPTISYQRGSINDITYPDYQCGLVVTDSTTALTAIPVHAPGSENVREIFSIPDLSGTARLHVITNYSGSYADIARNNFKNNSLYEMQKTYQDFYTSYFDEINSDSLNYTDNDATGTFITDEYYTIKNLLDGSTNLDNLSLKPFVISSVLETPKLKKRSMPFSLDFPANYHEEMIINLPKNYNVKKSFSDYKCAGFIVNKDCYANKNQLTLKYNYRTLKDYISPQESSDYFNSIEKTQQNINYFFDDAKHNSSFHKKGSVKIGFVLFIISFLIAGLIWWTQQKSA